MSSIVIRSIHHYMYCPHRWGLIEIDKAWAENLFVTKANLLHKRVHDPNQHYSARGKIVYTSVPVYHDGAAYDLYGILDTLELTKDEGGVKVHGCDGKYRLCIVEYKPTMPKSGQYNEEDLMQVFAQKVCADYVFHCDCDAVLYYGNVKKRIPLPLRERYSEYDRLLKNLLAQMRDYLHKGIIPAIRKGQTCNGCSMKDLCMPSAKKPQNLKLEIEKISKEDS